jgi:3-oxoacyl-(acyl-carrier-protein) synthase
MSGMRAFITGTGIISAVGTGWQANLHGIKSKKINLRPLSAFPVKAPAPLSGEIQSWPDRDNLPATHVLALAACQEALESDVSGDDGPVDAVLVGTTTGGMPTSEMLLSQNVTDPAAYLLHGAGTVAELLAKRLGCHGLTLTVCNACSSSTSIMKLGLELIRSGWARRVLTCGVDALTRLTFHGFRLLQLIDPEGARPFDANRAGMCLGEAAAAFVISAGQAPPPGALAEIRGGGLSCDAYHPVAPHPEGEGAAQAMLLALADAGMLKPGDIDYINMHGTGTRDNDASEATAVKRVFNGSPPALSSSKGCLGHTLGAAGALEAAICVMAMSEGILPPNWGLQEPDPDLGLTPLLEPTPARARLVLSNSIGFGGNNASLVLGSPGLEAPNTSAGKKGWLEVLAASCITGAGNLEATWDAFSRGKSCRGALSTQAISEKLAPRLVRRWKRLPRLALALALDALDQRSEEIKLDAILFSTGLGALSETHDFLKQLFESDWSLSSPIDFMGSVHNAPAGHVAQYFKAQGANLTFSGQDLSFEQSVLSAWLLAQSDDKPYLLIGADEAHPELTPIFNPAAHNGGVPDDGGGALLLRRTKTKNGLCLRPLFFEGPAESAAEAQGLAELIEDYGRDYGAIMAGIPADQRTLGEAQLQTLLSGLKTACPVIDYRRLLGDHHTVAAVAFSLACRMAEQSQVPAGLTGGQTEPLQGRPILLITLGQYVAANELF